MLEGGTMAYKKAAIMDGESKIGYVLCDTEKRTGHHYFQLRLRGEKDGLPIRIRRAAEAVETLMDRTFSLKWDESAQVTAQQTIAQQEAEIARPKALLGTKMP